MTTGYVPLRDTLDSALRALTEAARKIGEWRAEPAPLTSHERAAWNLRIAQLTAEEANLRHEILALACDPTLTLQTWWLSPLDNEPLGLVREMHVQASELPEVVEQLGDCEQWDYEQYGVTCTYLVLPGGVIDVSRLRPIPQAAERGGPHDPDNTVPSGARAE